MQGMYAEDANLMLLLSTALVEKQDFADARTVIDQLIAKHAAHKPNDARLLLTRTFEGQNQPEEALKLYEALTPVFVGLEARCRHGLLLKKLGHEKQAYAAFNDLLQHAKRHNVRHEGEQRWIDIAKQELRT
jgi:hypothetical protein